MRKTVSYLLAALLAVASGVAHAQTWPTKPVKLIIPAGQGGTIDPITRLVGDRLGKVFGQTFVPENHTGAQGNTGLASVARAEPDGYTLGVAASSMLAINPQLFKKMPYNPLKDLALVGLIGEVQNVLVVHPGVSAKNLKEFADYVKANPDKLNFGSTGNGSSMHLSGELFKALTGTRMQHIPYTVPGDATKDLIAGRLQVMFQLMTGIQGQVKAGQVRALAVLSNQRSTTLPDVPTAAEAGLPKLQSSVWFGVVAPQGTPQPILERVAAELKKLLGEADLRKRLADIGVEPMSGGPADFAKLLQEDYKKWGEIVKISGATID